MELQDHDLNERERSRSRERDSGQQYDDNDNSRWGNREDEPLNTSRPENNDQSSSSANLYITNLSFKVRYDAWQSDFVYCVQSILQLKFFIFDKKNVASCNNRQLKIHYVLHLSDLDK